ncbi:MAG TPA: hypothetical protein VEW69_04330 [Alphaproteobacteria bacterium]|nr:hypothetical protein [Alphaproteobacteria bacterium]
MAQNRKPAFLISYVTVTYRSVFLGALAVLALFALVLYFAFPNTSDRVIQMGQVRLQKLLVKMGILSPSGQNASADAGPQQAHFINIDGTVRVRKSATNAWVPADYNVALEKGDVVQTSGEGLAKITFADGTNYTVKPDSLIVVQDNSMNAAQQTRVSVLVTTGTVDLATATLSQGSKSMVSVAGATASLNSQTSAEVRNDAKNDQIAVVLKKGAGEISREGAGTVKLADNDKVSFTSESKDFVKTKEIAPPTLISPANMETVNVGKGAKPVLFSWTPVESATYHFRMSKNQFFSSLVIDQKDIRSERVELPPQLPEGSYYWEVLSVGEDGRESAASDINRFAAIPKADDQTGIALELQDWVQLGHIFEVRGRTEPGARVMVNGDPVASIASDGSFRHYTHPLPTGRNLITVTAQNSKGHSSTKFREVLIR